MNQLRQPAIFLSHGGGPCFWMDMPPPLGPNAFDGLRDYLAGLISTLPERPRAIVMMSGHWEADKTTVSTAAAPPMLFDYYNFPAHTYELDYPAPGDPLLAEQITERLQASGIDVATDSVRGFDHGVFVPMLIVEPAGDIPVVMVSMRKDYDPAHHIAVGRALAPLRDQGVLIIGSGNTYHNMGAFMDGDGDASEMFDRWLGDAVANPDTERRDALLTDWALAPMARECHPQEDHLLPLMAVAGAAGSDTGVTDYSDHIGGKKISGYRFG